jgi:uncharacterized membrane protein
VIRFRLRHALSSVLSSFWFWPLVFIVAAIYLAESIPSWASTVPATDLTAIQGFAADARVYAVAILTTTAAADVTILTFAFSSLMVVLQLASSQLSPRILRPTLRRGAAQLSMGIMAGGFVYSTWSLLGIYGVKHPLAVVATVMIAITWTFAVVVTFLYFVTFTISNIRAPAVIRFIGDETARSIRRTYELRPERGGDAVVDAESCWELTSHRDGVVTGLGAHSLVSWARKNDAVVELSVGLGDYVSRGVPVGRVRGAARPTWPLSLTRFLIIEPERTLRGDPPYGFRLLVDVANRALSPAVNDPTTAVQVLDELQSLLGLLAQRPDSPGRMYDHDGVLRLTLPVTSWRTYLNLAIQEIYEYGHASSQVTRRIARLLDDLGEVASEEQAPAVRELRERIEVIPPMVS